VGIQSFLLAVQHVKCNWNFKLLFILLPLNIENFYCLTFVGLGIQWCLVGITELEASCSADVIMQITVLVSSKMFKWYQHTLPKFLWTGLTPSVLVCNIRVASGPFSHLDRKQSSAALLTIKKAQNVQCRYIKNEREKVNFVILYCSSNVGTKATNVCLSWVLKL